MSRFVVQRHHATALHFDLRLELDGVLVSWAVPKGPSLDPATRRLAVRVGDHDLAHLDVEGRFPGGRGPGTVLVWDTGTYRNRTREGGLDVEAAAALAAGHLRVELFGRRLTGEYSLRRTALGGDDRNWLLIKVDDAGADRGPEIAETELTSVLTGRTAEDLPEEPVEEPPGPVADPVEAHTGPDEDGDHRAEW